MLTPTQPRFEIRDRDGLLIMRLGEAALAACRDMALVDLVGRRNGRVTHAVLRPGVSPDTLQASLRPGGTVPRAADSYTVLKSPKGYKHIRTEAWNPLNRVAYA